MRLRLPVARLLPCLLPCVLPSCTTAMLWGSSGLGSEIHWETVETESRFVTSEIRVRTGEQPPEQFWLRLDAQGLDPAEALDRGVLRPAPRWLAIAPDRPAASTSAVLSALLARTDTTIASAALYSSDTGDGQVWFDAEGRFSRGNAGNPDGPPAVILPLAATWVDGPPADNEVLWTSADPGVRVPLLVVHTNRTRLPCEQPSYKSALALLASPFTLAVDAAIVGLAVVVCVEVSNQRRGR